MQGDFERALSAVDEAFNVLRIEKVTEDSEEWIDMLRARAEIFARRGDNASARKIFEKVLSDLRTRFPAQIKDRISTLSMLGAVSLAMGDATSAQAYHLEETDLAERTYSAGHPIRLRASLQLSRTQHFLNRNQAPRDEVLRVAAQLRQILPQASSHHAALAEIVASVSNDASRQVDQTRAHLIF
jgi:tetratricopeptide (TPR) repeat protein